MTSEVFGLRLKRLLGELPDVDGYVPIKSLYKAFVEQYPDSGMRRVKDFKDRLQRVQHYFDVTDWTMVKKDSGRQFAESTVLKFLDTIDPCI